MNGTVRQQSIGTGLQSLSNPVPSGEENPSVDSAEFGADTAPSDSNRRSRPGHVRRYRRSYYSHKTLSGFRSPPLSRRLGATYRLYLLQVIPARIPIQIWTFDEMCTQQASCLSDKSTWIVWFPDDFRRTTVELMIESALDEWIRINWLQVSRIEHNSCLSEV